MSAELRRFMPALVVLVILGVAVYAGRSGTLTGSAAGAGCVAENGAPIEPVGDSSLAQVTDEAREAVDALVQLEVQGDDPRSMQAVEAATATIRDLGAVAVPALTSEFSASGCTMSASSKVVQLIDDLGSDASTYNEDDRMTMGSMLLNGAIHGGSGAESLLSNGLGKKNSDDGGHGADEGADENVKEDSESDGSGDSEEDDRVECVEETLETLVEWLDEGRLPVDDFLALVLEKVEALAEDDPVGAELVSLMTATAPQTTEWANQFEELAARDSLHEKANGAACEGAAARGSKLGHIVESLGADTPSSLAVCVINASREWETDEHAVWGLDQSDGEVVIAAAEAMGVVGSAGSLDGMLSMFLDHDAASDLVSALEGGIAGIINRDPGAANDPLTVWIEKADGEDEAVAARLKGLFDHLPACTIDDAPPCAGSLLPGGDEGGSTVGGDEGDKGGDEGDGSEGDGSEGDDPKKGD